MLLAAVVLVFLVWKGFDTITATLAASLVIILTSGINLWEGLSKGYAVGFKGFAGTWLFVMLIGAVFGQFLTDSGCAEAIALKVVNTFGSRKAILGLAICTVLFTYVGVSGFVITFTVVPIGIILFKKDGLPEKLIPAVIGVGVATGGGIMAYSLDIINILPTNILGTKLNAAPLLGFIAAAITFTLGYLYMMREAKKIRQESESEFAAASDEGLISNENTPDFKIAIIPFIAVIILTIFTSKFINPIASVVLSLTIGTFLVVLFNVKRLSTKMQSVKDGINRGIFALAAAAATIGFSVVVQQSPVFPKIIDSITSINLHPYITEVIGVNLISGVLGSATSGIQIFLDTLGKHFLDMGVSPEVLHRLAPIAGIGLNTLPHSPAVVIALAYQKLTHKEAYKYMFATSVVAPLISATVTVLAALIFY